MGDLEIEIEVTNLWRRFSGDKFDEAQKRMPQIWRFLFDDRMYVTI